MLEDGYLTFDGIDCIFNETTNGLVLYPTDANQRVKLNKHLFDKGFFFNYRGSIDKSITMLVKKVSSNFPSNSIRLIPQYIVKMLIPAPVFSIELVSEAIDQLFSPASYFYFKARSGKSENTDKLIYENEVADTWDFTYKGAPIQVTLLYGDILKRGKASDMKLHPKLKISFPQTENIGLIYDIYRVMTVFLQIARYRYGCGASSIRLCSRTDVGFIHGNLFDYSGVNEVIGYSEVGYELIKPYIGALLQFAADNIDLPIYYFPKDGTRFLGEDYNGVLFAALFAVFERECKQNGELYVKTDDSKISSVRNELVSQIEILKNAKSVEESEFISNVVSRIKDLGTQMGQKARIINACNTLAPILNSSYEHVFYYPELRIKGVPSKNQIKQIAEKLVILRNAVIHDGSKNEFTDEESQYVRFFEILVYTLILKRVGIPDAGIERLIGVVFNSNYVALNEELPKQI